MDVVILLARLQRRRVLDRVLHANSWLHWNSAAACLRKIHIMPGKKPSPQWVQAGPSNFPFAVLRVQRIKAGMLFDQFTHLFLRKGVSLLEQVAGVVRKMNHLFRSPEHEDTA